MPKKEMTVRDLARITLRVAAVSERSNPDFELSFGHVRQAYLPFVTAGKNPETRPLLPFTEAEWEVLENNEKLWQTIQSELGIYDDLSRRIQVLRACVPVDAWNADMTGSIGQTLCFGQALAAFSVCKTSYRS